MIKFLVLPNLVSKIYNDRGNWEISQRDSPRIIAMVSTDRAFLNTNPDYDEYSASTARNVLCCRSLAFIVISLSHSPSEILNVLVLEIISEQIY